MKITLHNFMKHPHLTITLKKGELTLISGESGSGKTSIPEAIKWCLYGNVKKVYHGEKEKVYVKIIKKNITIYRQARPGKLKVTIGNVVITDNKSAQATIDRYYYPSDVWRACSIIDQKKSCYLLECNNKKKMNIVSALAYNKDNPKKYRDMIQDFINKIKIIHREKVTQYELLVSQYDNEYEKIEKTIVNIEIEIENNNNILIFNINTLTEIQNILPVLTTKYKYQNKKKIEKDIVTKDIKEKENLLNSLSDINKENISSLNILLQEKIKQIDTLTGKNILYLKWMNLQEKLKKYTLNSNINTLDNINSSFITEKYFYECLSQENKYIKEKHKANYKNIEYNENIINDKIHKISILIENYKKINPFIPIYKRWKIKIETKKELDNIASLKEITMKDVYKERDYYNEIKKSATLMVCPHCDKSIQYKNGILVACEKRRVTQEEIQKQGNKAQELYNSYQIQNKLKILQNEIKSLYEKLEGIDLSTLDEYKPPNINNIYTLLSILKSIEIVKQPKHKSINIRRYIECNKVLEKSKNIPEDIKKMSEILIKDKLEKEIINIKSKYKKDHNTLKQKKQLTSEILKLKKKLKTIKVDENIIEEYTNITKKIIKLKDSISIQEKVHQKYTKLLIISKIKKEIDKYSTKMNILHVMLHKAINLSCKLLEDTVRSIGLTAEPILYNIFKKSVTLQLNLYKKLKGKKVNGKTVTKQAINLDISFDSEKHEKRLSGGEKDRISIALLLSLNIHSKSPFLLMDEVLSTVSYDTASKCLSQIKKHIKDKYVICIEHNSIEGEYDRVIRLGTN